MIIAGLTGSIAMGKTTVAQIFAAAGWPVFDADEAVHRFYKSTGARVVDEAFPGVGRYGAIDRGQLAARVLGNEQAMAKLESDCPSGCSRIPEVVSQYCCGGTSARRHPRHPAVI